jgi:hypothetical protein
LSLAWNAAAAPVLLSLLALVAPPAAATTPLTPTAPTRPMSDDEFIESLGDESIDTPVDRKRLARILFSLAATLDGGKSSVQWLQSSAVVPETSRQAVRSLLATRFGQYANSLARFRTSVTALLDDPDSLLLLHRTLTDGQRACWHFDLHNRLIESYGSESDLLSILSSREACTRLRATAFQPRVEGIVRGALVERVYLREEIRELEDDLAELERLLRDLEEIDAAE